MKLDILAFAAHPDDVEITCSGTLIKEIRKGRKVGIVDLTGGEMGTRGSKELRSREVQVSSSIMGIHARENLGFRDCFFADDESHRLEVVRMIRKYRPEVVLCNSPADRHPDHGRASSLVINAVFLSRLSRLQTESEGASQEAWGPRAVYHYIQDRYHRPDFVIDVTEVWEERMKVMMAFSSQFYDPDSTEPQSPISSREFLQFVEARSREFGRPAGYALAEGFLVSRIPAVDDLMTLR